MDFILSSARFRDSSLLKILTVSGYCIWLLHGSYTCNTVEDESNYKILSFYTEAENRRFYEITSPQISKKSILHEIK